MRIAIVEDDLLLRGNLQLLLAGESGIEVAGAWGSAEEALEALETAHPDVVLVDIDLPGMSGIDLIRQVRLGWRDVELMAYTILEDRDTVFAAIKAGASGYLLKGSTPRELVEALAMLHQGGAPMTPRIAKKVLLELRDEPGDEREALTHRELDILHKIREGLSYRDVARELVISPHTVHTHLKRIYEKLQASGRDDAVLKARRQGLL